MSDESLYEAALAYMEQYGETVGNGLAILITDAGEEGDMELVADLLAILGVIAEITGEDIELRKAPAVSRFSVH